LVGRDQQRQVVAECCRRARNAGVRGGMPVAQARALFDVGRVRVETHDPGRVRAALRSLAVWAHRLSPIVSPDPADGLLLDLTGCEQAFGGEDRWASTALAQLARLGVHARATIAPTFGCAWAVSRFGSAPMAIVAPGRQREALVPLPIAALRLEEAVVSDLATVGIKRIGELLDLPRSALPSRFGESLLLSLDRALGHAIETIEPVRPTVPHTAERVFDGPTDRADAIELTVRELLEVVTARLCAESLGARRIDIALVRSDLPPEHLSVILGRPSHDPRHLWVLVRPKLERAHLGFGVEAVGVTALALARVQHRQAECWDTEHPAASSRDLLLDTLRNRLGPDSILLASATSSHIPQRAFVMHPPSSREHHQPAASIARQDRPTLLLARPLSAEVIALSPDGPVRRVRCRGETHDVLACRGPERIAPEWWKHKAPTRDYFTVRCEDGRWLWLGRTLDTGRWYIHGIWA
jgi:protein ImuB